MPALITNALNPWLTLWESAPARESMDQSIDASPFAQLHSAAGAASHKDS